MYSKKIEVRYSRNTHEATVFIDGVPTRTYTRIVDALKEARSEFAREEIRRERISDDSDSNR